jgi:hypothetical protein
MKRSVIYFIWCLLLGICMIDSQPVLGQPPEVVDQAKKLLGN